MLELLWLKATVVAISVCLQVALDYAKVDASEIRDQLDAKDRELSASPPRTNSEEEQK